MSLNATWNFWEEAIFEETKLQHVRPDQHGAMEIDTSPVMQLDGTVESIIPASESLKGQDRD